MCIFDTFSESQEFEYDLLFTGGESVCSKNCLGNGSCQNSACQCQTNFHGDTCEVGLFELNKEKQLQIVVDSGKYQYFKVAKEDVADAATLNFEVSSSKIKAYVMKDTASFLPTSINTLKVLEIEASGNTGVGFKPEEEVPQFSKEDYTYLIFCISIFF